ncbi:MAG: ATP-binding cassette domain-containing protein [Proteobacteria bacterium]|nr:ATP-binding cassette domain-containing protein [Desulfobacula sp.]MBU3953074.1 ATP-binding cassette domain-containing protein [Pseudomonadota bacterium]MBU4132417.1 ATP-binding cassette domain-containing protein [Pseudomonadota bacterium]
MRLECNGLKYTYPESEVAVIDNLCFSMAGPGFNAVFGPSGVGKTSLAKLVVSQKDQPDSRILAPGMETILYSYNQERLPGWSSTGSHLDKVCPAGKEALKQELINIFKLAPVLDARFAQLSMGQQNRMNLIRYLLQEFDLLIMDESLANVDEALRENIILAIKALFPKKMFLYISHNLMEVAKFCKDILVLSEPVKQKGSFMVKGRDYCQGYTLDKRSFDATMLEIMDAF